MTKIVGIDFGTTNSLVAFAQNGKVRTIQSEDIERILPSIVCKFDGQLIIGKEAKENLGAFSKGDGIKEIKKDIGKAKRIKFDGRLMSPYEIAAIILKKIKRNLQLYFNEEIKDVVITVPAQFSDSQRKEIIQAGEAAGFTVRKIINEPTAALLTYAAENSIQKETVLCYDYGGGTFDVSIAEITSNYNGQKVKILATGGNRELGGSDIDKLLFNVVNQELKQMRGFSFNGQKTNLDFGALQIFSAVEALKIDLTDKEEASISIPNLRKPDGGTIGYFRKMKRSEFESLISKEIDKTIQIVLNVARESGVTLRHIDKVLLVGGSSRIPFVTKQIKSKLGIPATFGNINPDECVAIGAGIEAANLSGTSLLKKNVSITRDVCPFTLGLKYGDGVSNDLFDPLITKNFPYGEEFSEEYSTALNRQNTMELEIYQGESNYASENEKVCDFVVRNIPERDAGKEKIRITFKYNTDGILSIRAKVLSTGVEVTHTHKYGYSVEASRATKNKVESHFIQDDKVEEAIAMVESLKKHNAHQDKNRIIEAIKYENKDELDDIMAGLLD
ncbi:Hsp70 family protein [Exiguobacterium sp. s50]|uniref:Hsp70 family protein n=1 Tax=Exiguobacterium sp. s50 TaxID=2751234 RepID=UPI001BE907AE|nr:Hsp70 family protein [Exiguobacterium sp. s50]